MVARKQAGEVFMQDDVAKCFNEKNGGDQHHESEQHFVGARGEFDSLHGHHGDESHGNAARMAKGICGTKR